MLKNKSFESILYVNDNCMRFYMDQHRHLFYKSVNNGNPVRIFEDEILEYDIDMNPQGEIGIAILDKSGGLYYFHYDGVEWQNQLLYHVDVSKEDIRHIQIKFSESNTYILFCWNNLMNPKQWSIVCYYTRGGDWDKEVFSRVYLKSMIKPYILIRDQQDQLLLFYLVHNNLIYNIQFQMLSSNAASWSSPKFISNCIYVNDFYLDALADNDHMLHLCWCDKQKQSYCVKYLALNNSFTAAMEPVTLLTSKSPYIQSLLYIENHAVACLGFTNFDFDCIVNANKKTLHRLSNWKIANSKGWDLTELKAYKIIYDKSHANHSYHANYILSDDESEYSPIPFTGGEQIIHQSASADPEDSIFALDQMKAQEKEIQQLKKMKIDNFKLQQELLTKNNMLKTYESEIQFIEEKLKKLENDYKTLSQTLEVKQKKMKDQTDSLHQHLTAAEKLETKNKELLKEVSLYQQKINQLHVFSEELKKENQHYKEELESMAKRGLFRRIFD